MGGYWSGKAPLAPLPALAHPAAFLCGIGWGCLASSADGASLGGAGSAVMTSAGPWPCALGSAFPLSAPLITRRGTMSCSLLCYRGELLLWPLAGSAPASALGFPLELLGTGCCWPEAGTSPPSWGECTGKQHCSCFILFVQAWSRREGEGCGSEEGITCSQRRPVRNISVSHSQSPFCCRMLAQHPPCSGDLARAVLQCSQAGGCCRSSAPPRPCEAGAGGCVQERKSHYGGGWKWVRVE